MNRKNLIFTAVLSIVAGCLINRFAAIVDACYQADKDILSAFSKAAADFLPALVPNPLPVFSSKAAVISGLIAVVCCWMVYLYRISDPYQKVMPGTEHGSGRWGTERDIKPFIDKTYAHNILLTQTERLSMSNRMKRTATDDFNRNKNVVIIGGSGSGKSLFYVIPQLCQLYGNYVVIDPKGELLHKTAAMMQANGYAVKVVDLIEFNGDKYNPFAYIQSEIDIIKTVDAFITSTKDKRKTGGDEFWDKSMRNFLCALFAFAFYFLPLEEQNFNSIFTLLQYAEASQDESYKSVLDELFEDANQEMPNNFAYIQYQNYAKGAPQTKQSVLATVAATLSPCQLPQVAEMLKTDEVEIERLANKKTAVYIVLSDTSTSFTFLAAMLEQQMFERLIYLADHKYGGELPIHTRFLMDEFANVGQIPNFKEKIATIRSRNLSVSIVLQNISQLKVLYPNNEWETIMGNCDSLLYLGGMEEATHKYISEICGKTTVRTRSYNQTKGTNGSYSINQNLIQRDLITLDETASLKGRECILKIRGVPAFKSKKFNTFQHKNYVQYVPQSARDRKWFLAEDRLTGKFSGLKKELEISKKKKRLRFGRRLAKLKRKG